MSENRGISFGLLPSNWWAVITFIIVIIFIFVYLKKPNLKLTLLVSGGLSNILDRIIYGAVVDFIKLPVFPWKFNLADAMITLGVALLFLKLTGSVTKINEYFKSQNYF